MTENWGPGNKFEPFDKVLIKDETIELGFGEHPHSRNDNDLYVKFPDGRIEGFAGHRVCWEIQIEEYNYLKQSELSGDEIRQGCTTSIFANKIKIYELSTRTYEQALFEIRVTIDKLLELPFALWKDEDRETLIGRKVYYRNTPAKITMLLLEQGCVMMIADNSTGLFPNPPYRKEDDMEEQDEIKAEVIDPNIWWYRD